jgi:hypothetical protein
VGSDPDWDALPRYLPRNFNPTIPVMIKPKHASRLKAADSPNSTIPINTVPTAPMPVHTAYAVPSGRLRVATPTSPKLNTIMVAVATDGHRRVNHSEYFSPMENPISNTPASTWIAQAYCLIVLPLGLFLKERLIPRRKALL